jgi:hypothetical protein
MHELLFDHCIFARLWEGMRTCVGKSLSGDILQGRYGGGETNPGHNNRAKGLSSQHELPKLLIRTKHNRHT